MSIRMHVEAYSGYKLNEHPMRFDLDEEIYEIEAVEDRWQKPRAEYFKVRTRSGKRYLLRYDEAAGQWTLRSGFDGDELFARPNVELIPVCAEHIGQAESRIAGCERCRPEDADQPFDWIIAHVLNKTGPCEFVLTEPARCPRCHEILAETTSIEAQGGIEVESESLR
jgi:hypothetical protein